MLYVWQPFFIFNPLGFQLFIRFAEKLKSHFDNFSHITHLRILPLPKKSIFLKMDKEYEVKYHEQEETNWWFVSRRNIILQQLKGNKVPSKAKILDIGSAGGILSLYLISKGYENVYSLDYSEDAIALCKKRGLKNAFVMDGQRPDFPEHEFDVIIASDSLEHLFDDKLALNNWFKILKANGIAIIYVPAFMWLWSKHDEINFHYRRYTRKELNNKLTSCGFTIVKSGYWNFLVFIPTAILRLMQKAFKKGNLKKMNSQSDQLLKLPKWINKILMGLVIFENKLTSKIRLPIGISTFAIAKK